MILLASKSGIALKVLDEIGITDFPWIADDIDDEDAIIPPSHDCLKQSFLHVDASRIDQVIRNIINNAIKCITERRVVTVSFDLVRAEVAFNAASYNSDVIGAIQIKVFAIQITLPVFRINDYEFNWGMVGYR